MLKSLVHTCSAWDSGIQVNSSTIGGNVEFLHSHTLSKAVLLRHKFRFSLCVRQNYY